MSIHAQGVSYSYGATQALDDVSFQISRGSFCALLGPNGAGKSTLFALLTRLFTTREGALAVAGHDLQREPLKALAAVGVVFQQPTLDLDLSVSRNLRYFAALHGFNRREADRRIAKALERLSMAHRADEPVRKLNGGHRRRTEIARALLHEPRVLLLDEPTVGLDASARSALVDHVHALAADGLTVLWATHLTDEVRDGDRLIVLHRGRIQADGMAGEIAAGRPLLDVFLALTGSAATP